MIKVSRPQLSSPERDRLKKWLVADQASLMIELVNSEITALQAELSNCAVKMGEFPNQAGEGKAALEQIKVLQNFLTVFAKYTKMEEYSAVTIEPTHE